MNYLLAAWLFMPSFLMVVFSLPSLAIGLIATSIVAMFSTLLLNLKRRIRSGGLYPTILAAAAISIFLSYYGAQQPLSQKQGLAIVGLIVLAFAAPTLLHYYFSRKASYISRELKWLYLIFVVIGLTGVVSPIRVGEFSSLGHPVFPFAEPSHYALAYAQIASLTLPFLKHSERLLVVLATLLLALSLPSVTLLVPVLLLLLITVSTRLLLLLVLIFVAVIYYMMRSSPDALVYFTDRLISGGPENLSRLVYVQGWESLISAVSMSNGLGIGFQNLGNEPPGSATEIIRALTNEIDLNRADGGFLFAKIGGEFGVVGILAMLSLLILAILSGLRLRRELRFKFPIENALAIVPLCSTYIIIVEVLVRGVGYFSPTFIIAIYFIPMAIRILRRKTSSGLGPTKTARLLDNYQSPTGHIIRMENASQLR
jgi:hypothetical protein